MAGSVARPWYSRPQTGVPLRAKLAAVLLLTVACLAWVLWGIDPASVKVALTGARWWLIGAAVATYWFTHVLRTWRFQLLIDNREDGELVPFWRMFSICGVSFLAIQVVPFRLGELVRPYLLAEQPPGDRVPMGQALAAVVLERLLDFLMLLGLMLLVSFGLELPAGSITVGGVDIVAVGQRAVGTLLAAGAIFLAALLIAGESAAARLGEALRWIPAIGPKLPGFLLGFAAAPRSLLQRPALGAAVTALSAAVWFFTVVGVWLGMLAFDGIPHGLTAAAVVWTACISGAIAVPTPGFFGPFEAFCLAALMLWEVDLDAGRTFAVVLHLTQFGFTIALGGYYLVKEGLSLRRIVSESQAAAPGI